MFAHGQCLAPEATHPRLFVIGSAPTALYTLSLHDALPIYARLLGVQALRAGLDLGFDLHVQSPPSWIEASAAPGRPPRGMQGRASGTRLGAAPPATGPRRLLTRRSRDQRGDTNQTFSRQNR